MISINTNLMATNTANALSRHYGRLQTSTERLSSGLRINGADDDAAGLAIREMMRADIAALNQGVRNVNDAISMIQTFDGALGVIDEKLIRMKELAEQAATGTYTSDQRLMIDSEFQAMGSEIDRIANATDFNGVKLLCTKMMTWYEDVTKFRITDSGSIDNIQLPTGKNGTPVLSGANANNYVNEANPTKTISVSLTATAGTRITSGPMTVTPTGAGSATYGLGDTDFKFAYVDQMGNATNPVLNYNNPPLTTGGPNWTIRDDNQAYTVVPNPTDPSSMGGMGFSPSSSVTFSLEDAAGNPVDLTRAFCL